MRGAIYDGLRRGGALSRRAMEAASREAAAVSAAEPSGEELASEGGAGDDRESLAEALDAALGRVSVGHAQQEGESNPEEALSTRMEKVRLRWAVDRGA